MRNTVSSLVLAATDDDAKVMHLPSSSPLGTFC